jgi:uncharacterized protein with HEPN domain
MPLRTPRQRLEHILDNAERALLFIEGKQRQDLVNDTLLLYGLLHCLQIIGEAASTIPNDVRDQFSGIPWELMIRMRHHLVHDYDAVVEDVVWDTVTRDLPKLIEAILKVIPPEQT